MAGSGYKLFNTGDVLTAQQVNEYLMQQTVMCFASSAARTTALSGVVAEGMVSYLKDTNATEVYDGSAWVGIANAGDITAVTTGASSGLTGGATSGAVDLKFNTTAKGGMLIGTGSGTVSELAVGTNNYILTADSTQTTGVKWAAASSGGGWTLINTGGTSVNGLTTCTISSIPSTYKSLKILCVGIKRNAASGGVLGLQLNTDTSAAYLYGQKKFSDTSESYTVSTGTSSYEICAQIAQSNGGDMEADVAVIDIDNYTNTTYGKAIAHHASGHQNNWIQQFGSGFYASASAISSISIISSAAMGAGTVYVYGVS